MTSAISSESAQVETPVSARLSNAVVINGDTVIPAGAELTGTVTDVERSGRVKGRAHIAFAFNEVRMNNGREDLRTDPVNFEAEATKGEDATKVGAGAVGGAILGGILGGKKGAAKGAIAGGAVGRRGGSHAGQGSRGCRRHQRDGDARRASNSADTYSVIRRCNSRCKLQTELGLQRRGDGPRPFTPLLRTSCVLHFEFCILNYC